jgi:Ca2+-binding EF-hand superfamily protein
MISASQTDDGVIDFDEFCERLGISTKSLVSECIFNLFDTNLDGAINFREFLMGISTFINSYTEQNTEHYTKSNDRHLISSSKLNDQIEVSFRLFNLKGESKIYESDLKKLLGSCI